MRPEVEITDIRNITELVKNKYNYDFSNYATSSLRRRVARVLELEKMQSCGEILIKLGESREYFRHFLSEITVNVTEMFRDPSMWRYMRDSVLPHLFETHENIRIWHAGCSSGEEVLSLSIILKEMGKLDNVSVFATDIDHNIIERAKNLVYPIKTMHSVNDKNYIRLEGAGKLSDYYEEKNEKAYFDLNLISHVNFMEHNLTKLQSFAKFDLIMCRNVLIYFNQELQNSVYKMFHESLTMHGYLTIGHKETLAWSDIANKFITVSQEEKTYKKIRD